MPRVFWLPPESRQEDRVIFKPEKEHHILRVLRMKEGDPVEVLCENLRIQVKLIRGSRGLEGKIVSISNLPSPHFSVDLAQSLPKGRKFEQVVSLASQVGVRRLLPFLSARSVPRLSPGEKSSRKQERWRNIAEEEARVTGDLPVKVEPLVSFSRIVDLSLDYPLSLLFWENAERPLREVFTGEEKPTTVLVVIGPEGGFSPEEAREAEDRGFSLVNLGSRILRSEIAGFVATAILLERWGDLAS